MHDWLSTGYYIATNRDIHCIYREDDTKLVVVGILGFCLTVKIMKILISPTHSKHQLMEDNFSFLRGDGSTEQPYDAFKFKVPWCVATPSLFFFVS